MLCHISLLDILHTHQRDAIIISPTIDIILKIVFQMLLTWYRHIFIYALFIIERIEFNHNLVIISMLHFYKPKKNWYFTIFGMLLVG